MVDRENVIEALERCINGNHDGCQYKYGGAATFEHCRSDLMRDALALLKEQEPVTMKPYYFNYVCSGCGSEINGEFVDYTASRIKFCPCCGRKMEDTEHEEVKSEE